jgi:hypothetical protein
MTNDTVKKEQLIAELKRLMEWYKQRHRTNKALQWTLTALIAAAGVLTSAAGIQKGPELISSSNALLAWGLIAAVGAAINQVGSPGAASERNLNIKLTLKRLKYDLEFTNLPVEKAADILGIAVKDPDRATEVLERELEKVRMSE